MALFAGFTITILTDQQSLQGLCSQLIQTLEQHYWLTKLLGYDFIIKYRPEPSNAVVDALSRLSLPSCSSLSMPYFQIIDQLKEENSTDSELVALHDKLRDNPSSLPEYSIRDGLLYKGTRLVLWSTSPLRS